ncbi:probable histone-lysine N-methyltransferase CG1716 isoform X2 [Eupeodes corollae]|uniref:probable histone-lysine N-methyltransferase CG1716 isoform X2 n=1 Tax=Eupeodes corollae TaxID=290404 RepID=UPI002492FD7B|nr:probable histone-lysine N-methyltransferase CG1716 isoform X2 [Eupeodes corollae]
MHKKLNAVMQMDPPGSRRRLGRNPIVEQQQQQQQEQQQQQQQDSSSSPTDVDSSNEGAGPGGSAAAGGNSAECRRSSRKKTIKFDVRDLLNKNRKSHKIQIEARIDSNAPKVGAGQVSKAELDSKQKNFIEKSAIFRRFSISENKLPPRPPPPPGALIHTIQQCVGELEQLPLDGGELNLAAISPIARRLSRTQDILTASMMKPKQVSSLIVTKLESATTSKAAVQSSSSGTATASSSSSSSIPQGRMRMGVGKNVPSNLAAIPSPKKPQKRGRKPKAKLFSESTTESSSSNDGFDLSANSKLTPLENIRSTEEVPSPVESSEPRVNFIDENSTTGIDLKENLDASAVTLPQPIIQNDSAHNSTDDSFVAAQEDAFTARVHSSDESTTGSLINSPKSGRKGDDISLFGRSNSTETNSSEDSEKRHRKIRISVKRVSLTPQKSPRALSFEQTDEPIEVLSSTNDENSTGDTIMKSRKPKSKLIKGKPLETCATPPIILLESDTSNAASVSSSVIEITSLEMPTNELVPEQSQLTNLPKGRSCKLIESIFPKATQKSLFPQNADVSPKNRSSSSTKSAPSHLPIETSAATRPSTIPEDESQSEDLTLLSKEGDTVSVGADEDLLNEEATEESNEKTTSQVRSLRSAQNVQIKPPTPPAATKRQRKIIKGQSALDTSTEQYTKIQQEVLAAETSKDDERLESVKNQELSRSIEESEAGIKQSLKNQKEALSEPKNRASLESDKNEELTSPKPTRSRGFKQQERLEDQSLSEETIPTKASKEEEEPTKTQQPDVVEAAKQEEKDSKSEKESTHDSEDTTTPDRRRETLRTRSSVQQTKRETQKKICNLKITTTNSSTLDSSSECSECPEKCPKNRRQIILEENVIDDKSKEETSSLCSETSSITSSSSSSSSMTASSSKTSSTSTSSSNSSSSSSSSSAARSTRSSKSSPKVPHKQQDEPQPLEAIRNKSPVSPGLPADADKTQSNKSDSESSENFSSTKTGDTNLDESEKLRERRKSMRLQRSSSEPDRDSEESETSPQTARHTSKTRSGRSRCRAERGAEMRKKLSKKGLDVEVELDKASSFGGTTPQKPENEQTDASITNQEAPEMTNTSISPRAKSKKRTRRFVPIKYSSSESGTLSDDGNNSIEMTSMRLTRTRRKTISSASELEEIPPSNLSPPDCALEYVRRKSKPNQSKIHERGDKNSAVQELEHKKDDNKEGDVKCDSNADDELTPRGKPKAARSRKVIRNSSKGPTRVQNEVSTQSPKESNESSIDTKEKIEVERSEPASPASSFTDLSAGEELVETPRPRKVTRSFLKTKIGDSGNKEWKDLESSVSIEEERIVEKNALVELPRKTDLKDDKENKSAPQATEEYQAISEDVLDSGLCETKSPRQRKGTKLSAKSPTSIKSKKESKELIVDQNDEKTDKPKESGKDTEAPQPCTLPNDHSKDDTDKSTPKSSDLLPISNLIAQEVITTEENKEDPNSKPTEIVEKFSAPRKGTRLSLKKLESSNLEDKSKDLLENDKNQAQCDESMSVDDQVLRTSRQRKPTRFSAKKHEIPKVDVVVQQTQEISETSRESGTAEKGPESASPRIKKTTRSTPKVEVPNDLAVVEQSRAECQPIGDKVNEPTEISELKKATEKDTETVTDASLKSTNLEGNLVHEQNDVTKLVETPKRRRKPTRFSPKSPDRPTIEKKENVLKPSSAEKSAEDADIDDTKKTEEPKTISTLADVLQPVVAVKSPRVRKGTRFSPKNAENLQIQSKVVASTDAENTSLTEIPEEPSKPTRVRKGVPRILDKSSEDQKIEEEIKKMLHDCQTAINDVTSISSTPSTTSLETKEQPEILKSASLRTKKGTRLSAQTPQVHESSEKDDKTKPELPTDALRYKTTTDSQQKPKPPEIEPFTDAKVPNVSIVPTPSDDQMNPLAENPVSHSQIPIDLPQELNKSVKDKLPVERGTESEMADLSVSPSPYPQFKPDVASKKAIQKQLQSMLASLTSEPKMTFPKETTTPRRKRKTLGEQQEPINSTKDTSSATKKVDEPLNQEIDMKIVSSDSSNPTDDSMKPPHEEPSKIDPKQTPRRQLDSSFIESLEKSLLRPTTNTSTKKVSKKKEIGVTSSASPSKPPKEDTKSNKSLAKKLQETSEELKKSEHTSPKFKKKQAKESPKVLKKLSTEDQTATTKRKSAVAAKPKETEETKSLESRLSDLFQDDPMNKQSPDVPTAVFPQAPMVHKTKAETKFFSPEKRLIPDEMPLEPMPISQKPSSPVKEKSPDLLPDPLKDIEKFIEDGVNLLKRSYKIDADDDGSLDRDTLKSDETMTPKKCKLDESVVAGEGKQPGGSPRDDDNSNSNSECSTMTANTSTSEVDTPNGIRRSHRIKNNTKSSKCLVGRGLVRERERFSMKNDDEKTIYSIDDQKLDLAEVEAKNSKFLKDMEERLSNFRVIRENEYKCERVISKEAKRMLCDCFLTQEEEERGELGCGEDCLNRLLMIECGSDCTVRDRCTNRRFNKFLYSPCRVFRTEKKGFGIMADIEILPGEFIMEYVGEVINGDEFEFRINEYSKDKNKHYYFMALRSDAVIDATAKGNISRFINHSCEPNAETQKWTVNGELRIGFFSRKSIMPGEEITFDYQYQRYGKEAQRCYCESANCRGWIGAEPSSEEEEEYDAVDEEDESEETEEDEAAKAAEPVSIVPSPIPAIVDVANSEKQPLVPLVVTTAEVPAVDVEMTASLTPPTQPVAETPTPSLTETTPAVVPEKPKEQLPKKKKEKKRLLEEKLKRREPKQFLEDPDIEDEVRFLVKCGLRNQADTLRLSRLIVRAKLLETRINLLQILRQGELPCRRLFLDYHGLRLLHGWMSEVLDTRDTDKSMEIRMELLSALECLPISNKTMLTDSKVYQTVRDWSNNKESHSPSDGSPKEAANVNTAAAPPTTEDASSELQKLAAKLVHTWDNLPEVFRIPKRERIEQMKEHEREADRQYKVLERGLMSSSGSDVNRNRERFKSKSGPKGRFNWSKDKERERMNERRKYAQNNNSGKDGNDKSAGSQACESHLSKEQRRELFAAKVARDEAEKRLAEERREFDIKCRFFGLDPKRMRPENMPFCVNPSTGQWYSTDKKAISTPPSYAHVQVPVKPKSTNPEDYRLPTMDLPPLWKFAISPKGKIYYYHVKIRIPQWEPPIKILPLAGQHNTEVKNSESDSSTAGINDSSEDDIEVIKGLDPVKLQAYIEKKIEDRRLQRYTRLVEEKPISPRKEEDRIYNQMEVRKYKENKEKIRKRKEEIRRRRDIIVKASLDGSNLSEAAEAAVVEATKDALPIQDYLLSSEEEEILKAECNNSPLIDKIVQGDKIVDELDALQRKRALKRALPIRDKYDHKKRKVDKTKDSSKSTKRNKDGEGSSSSSKYRKVREKFRCEIAGIIVQHLKPYRDESCFTGKILTDDDFNHLARKLTHFVMVKELKYCESIGQTLIVTESVKNKSREFIKKYMAKYGKVYVRPKNDPEFKDIPFL